MFCYDVSMNHILIYGAPGAGKTTTSKLWHKKTSIFLYEGDYLREVIAQKMESETKNPFLYVGTKQAWRKFGDLTVVNVEKGLLACRESMKPYLDKELAKHDDIIFEAAFIEPAAYPAAKLFLVITLNEEKHRKQFYEHRREDVETEEGFKASRIIQDLLIDEAKSLDITIIQSENGPKHLLEQYSL